MRLAELIEWTSGLPVGTQFTTREAVNALRGEGAAYPSDMFRKLDKLRRYRYIEMVSEVRRGIPTVWRVLE